MVADCLREDDVIACAAGHGDTAQRLSWEAHLDTCRDCRRLVSLIAAQRTAHGDPPQDPAVPRDTSPRVFAGQRIGRFELVRPLGVGGMGVVFEALDPELDRRVAIKLMRFETFRDRRVAEDRWMRESRALAQLSHPNVVTLYEAGRHGDEVFLAMELVAGIPVAEWLASRPPHREVLDAFLQAGRGLAAAHAAGLIHRDVKPENLLRGSDGRVRISDFGVVRRDHDAPDPQSQRLFADGSVTRAGSVVGTPKYMAPEIRTGSAGTRASDQWSFAASLWIALGGKLMPRREPRVPRRLRAVLLRGLAPDPAARWPSMDAMLRQLAPHRRTRWLVVVAGLALAAAAVALMTRPEEAVDPCLAAASEMQGAWGPTRSVALSHRLLALGDPRAVDLEPQIRHTLDDRAAKWRALRLRACRNTGEARPASLSEPGLQVECLERQRHRYGTAIEGFVRNPGNPVTLLDAAQDLPQIDECASVAHLSRLQRLPDDPVRRQQLTEVNAELERAVDRWNDKWDATAIEVAERAAAASKDFAPLRVRALALKAGIQRAKLDPQLLATAHEGVAAAMEAGDEGRLAWFGSYQVYAASMITPRPAEEVDWLLRENEIRINAFARLAPDAARNLRYDFLVTRATVYYLRKDNEKGIADARALNTVADEAFGVESWRAARARGALIPGLIATKRYDEALAVVTPTLGPLERYLAPAHQELAGQLSFLGLAQFYTGDVTRALATERRALAMAKQVGPEGLYIELLAAVADMRATAGELTGALADYRTVIATEGKISVGAYDPPHIRALIDCTEQAIAAGAQRARLLAAAQCYRKATLPQAAAALLEPLIEREASPPRELDVRIRRAFADALRERARTGDDDRARSQADRAARDCARIGCTLQL